MELAVIWLKLYSLWQKSLSLELGEWSLSCIPCVISVRGIINSIFFSSYYIIYGNAALTRYINMHFRGHWRHRGHWHQSLARLVSLVMDRLIRNQIPNMLWDYGKEPGMIRMEDFYVCFFFLKERCTGKMYRLPLLNHSITKATWPGIMQALIFSEPLA